MKKNVASQKIGAQLVSATDGSAFTGSVTVSVTGDAGTQATGSVGAGACTHEGNGYHTYAPAQAETNYDLVAFTFTGSGAVPVTIQIYTAFPQTGDSFARIGAPVGASISADIAGVQSDTDNIQTRLPAALVSGRIDASVGAMAANVMTAAAAAADLTTELQSGLATASALSTAQTTLDAILVDTGTDIPATLATIAGYIDTEIGAIISAIAALPTNASMADAVWDEVLSGHLTAGSTGNALNAAGAAGDPWSTALPGAYGAGTAGKIIGDNINATISSRASQTSVDDLPTNAELATSQAAADDATLAAIAAVDAKIDIIDTNVDSVLVDTGTTLDAAIAAVKSDTAAILIDTGTTLDGKLDTIASYIDTEVGALITAVDALPTNAELATALGTADDAVLAAIAALNNLSAAQVATELATFFGASRSELGAVPAANASLIAKITWLAMLARNKVTQTATTQTVYADDGTTAVATSTDSDDGTTATRGEFV